MKKPVEVPAKGLVEVFTGNGRGKTSAALGIVMRASGQGLKCHIVIFMKGNYPYGEQNMLNKLPGVSLQRYGQLTFVDPNNIKPEEKEEAREALDAAERAIMSGKYDLVVLDEVNVAAAWKLVDINDVISVVKSKPEQVTLILTGRFADEKLLEIADLVTEMREIKHPFQKGAKPRKGFDF